MNSVGGDFFWEQNFLLLIWKKTIKNELNSRRKEYHSSLMRGRGANSVPPYLFVYASAINEIFTYFRLQLFLRFIVDSRVNDQFLSLVSVVYIMLSVCLCVC